MRGFSIVHALLMVILANQLASCDIVTQEYRDKQYGEFKKKTESKGLEFDYISQGETSGTYMYIVYDKNNLIYKISKFEKTDNIIANSFPYANDCKRYILNTNHEYVKHISFDCSSEGKKKAAND